MKKKYLVLSFTLLSLANADITKTPYYCRLHGLEASYYIQTLDDNKTVYSVEKSFVSTKSFNEGVAYFIPDRVYKIILSNMSSIAGFHIDGFISRGNNNKIDICRDNVLSYYTDIYNISQETKKTFSEVVINKFTEPKTILYHPLTGSFDITHTNIKQKEFNYWLYIIPGTERLESSYENNTIKSYKSMKYGFVYSFLKDDIDMYIKNITLTDEIMNKCSNEITYLTNAFDTYVKKIENRVKELDDGKILKFKPKKKKDFKTLDEIEIYIEEINEKLKKLNDSKIDNYISTIKNGLIPGAKQRKNKTENFCRYINYITELSEYTSELDSKIVKINSCPELQDENIEKFLNLYSPIYQINGIFVNYDFYGVKDAFDWVFITNDKKFYQLRGNKPTKNNVFGWKKIENITINDNNENSWYMAYLYDWDNDADKRFDWILINKDNKLVYKLKGVKNGIFDYEGPINIKAKIIDNYVKFESMQDAFNKNTIKPETTGTIYNEMPKINSF